jgi:hypothetical protein
VIRLHSVPADEPAGHSALTAFAVPSGSGVVVTDAGDAPCVCAAVADGCSGEVALLLPPQLAGTIDATIQMAGMAKVRIAMSSHRFDNEASDTSDSGSEAGAGCEDRDSMHDNLRSQMR